jgi:hypothetical protein
MPQTILPNNPSFVLPANGIIAPAALDKTFTAADIVNGNAFLSSGRDLLVVFNSDSSSHTFTLFSAPDADGRFANVTYTVGAGVYSFVDITTSSVFIQATNFVLVTGSDTHIQFLVVMNA